jgi:hypothetical protein
MPQRAPASLGPCAGDGGITYRIAARRIAETPPGRDNPDSPTATIPGLDLKALGMHCWNIALSVWFLAASAQGAEDAPTPAAATNLSQDEIRQGFVSIFDSKSLDGWRGSTTGYVAENGLLVCKKQGGGSLFTVKELGDFAFRFEFKLEPGGNNGVSVRGHEIQILDDYAPKHQNIKPCQYHGSIYCAVPAKRGHTKPAGEWNTEEIMCQGSRWKVTVNDAVIVDVDLATVSGAEALAQRTKGPLGFLGHGSLVEFRNLRVKSL